MVYIFVVDFFFFSAFCFVSVVGLI